MGGVSREQSIIEYQVKQTRHGVEIPVVSAAKVEVPEVGHKIADALERIGIKRPMVIIRPVIRLDRLATGKLKRFIPLSNQ